MKKIIMAMFFICAALNITYADSKELLFIKDPVGDDKGPGYYQYPQDKRLSRGTFDIKSFKVIEEDEIYRFEIRMRNYIMQEWPDTHKSEYQGFVANLWDIYIDIDGIPNSGYKYALTGRDLNFADNMGWEKMILISPISELALENILNDKIDELEFQDQVPDIVFPEYVKIQRDTIILRIAKSKLPRLSERSGFQVLSMGYRNIVSPNRLLNRDVKSFPTFEDFGGGSDYYGEPAAIDIIVPDGYDQYDLLKRHKAQPFRESIEYAEIPFVYSGGKRKSPAAIALDKKPLDPPVEIVVQVEQAKQSVSTDVMHNTDNNAPQKKQAEKIRPLSETKFMPLTQNKKQGKTAFEEASEKAKSKNNFTPLVKEDVKQLNGESPKNGFVPLNRK